MACSLAGRKLVFFPWEEGEAYPAQFARLHAALVSCHVTVAQLYTMLGEYAAERRAGNTLSPFEFLLEKCGLSIE